MKNSILGLDLILDKNNKLWLIEVNSSPGFGHKEIRNHTRLLKELFGRQLVLFYRKKDFGPLSEIFLRYLKSVTKCNLCFLEDNSLRGPLIDVDGKVIKRATVLAECASAKPRLEKHYKVISPFKVAKLASDKFKVYNLFKDTDINTPRTFKFKTRKELKKILDKNGFKKFVIKPRYGQKGKHVFVKNKGGLAGVRITKDDWIVQDDIEMNRIGRKYWDIRALVVGGKYTGAIKRVSRDPVVNISRGGEYGVVESSLHRMLKPLTEEVVKIINKSLV